MKTRAHFWYLAEFFLKWERFRIKIKTDFFVQKFFSRKWCLLWDNVEKYDGARLVTDDNIKWRMRFTCWISKATDTTQNM
jgi:hypothetical protein